MGSAQAEDPLGKVVFFTKLAEAVPTESAVFCRSGIPALLMEGMEKNLTPQIFTSSQYVPTTNTYRLIMSDYHIMKMRFWPMRR